jgi:integrase
MAELTTLEDVLAAVERLQGATAAPGPLFAEFAHEWIERQRELGRLRPNTLKAYEDAIRCHLEPSFGALAIDCITVAAVDDWVADMRTRGLSAGTANSRLATLTSILATALDYELVARNVAQGRNRRLPKAIPSRTWLSRVDHIEALLSVTRNARHRALFATLTFAGLRVGEALALRWPDVDLTHGTLDVTEAKTRAGIRTVNVLPVLAGELARFREESWMARPGDLVFGTRTGRADTRQFFGRRLRANVLEANELLAAAGAPLLPVGLSPHSFRRTFASILFALAESAPYVQAQIGHVSAGLTLTAYARSWPREDVPALRRLVCGEGEPWDVVPEELQRELIQCADGVRHRRMWDGSPESHPGISEAELAERVPRPDWTLVERVERVLRSYVREVRSPRPEHQDA